MIDGHRKLVGCSAIPARSCPGPQRTFACPRGLTEIAEEKRTKLVFCTRSKKGSYNRSSLFEPKIVNFVISFWRGSCPPLNRFFSIFSSSRHPALPLGTSKCLGAGIHPRANKSSLPNLATINKSSARCYGASPGEVRHHGPVHTTGRCSGPQTHPGKRTCFLSFFFGFLTYRLRFFLAKMTVLSAQMKKFWPTWRIGFCRKSCLYWHYWYKSRSQHY